MDDSLAIRFPESPAVAGRETASLITHVPDRPAHDRRYAMNAGRVERELGFEPDVDFEAGLRYTLKWYLDHEVWWREVMDGSYREWIHSHYGANVSF
jgi:dTDP-glucose 4,6-dehydratase